MADAPVPKGKVTLPKLRAAAQGCTACRLYQDNTGTVFGEGPARPRIMLLGEQPGDEEDRAGHPFVGPAGRLLDELLAEAGIDRARVYVTNVVKHFSHHRSENGKRRLHDKPKAGEIKACRPWLEAELRVLKPAVIVCLGATAATSIFGRGVSITHDRGELRETPFGILALATYHPSAVLRARAVSSADARRIRQLLVADLATAAKAADE